MAGQVVLSAVVLMIVVAVQASAQPPPQVTIDSVTYAGSGCNYDNTGYVLSNDYRTVTFMFGGMFVTTDGSLADKRKHCQMSFFLNYPDDRSFSIRQATARAFADIARDSAGIYETHYYFSGQTGTATIERKIEGPKVGSFDYTDKFLTSVWTKCNNAAPPTVSIKTVVRVEGKKAVMAPDSHDTKFQIILDLLWSKCPKNVDPPPPA